MSGAYFIENDSASNPRFWLGKSGFFSLLQLVQDLSYTKNEVTKKALEGLKREIEAEEAGNDGIEIENEDLDSAATENELDDEQDLYTGEFLKDEVWSGLEEEVQKLAIEVAKIALRVTLRYMMRASTGGSVGGLFL